MSRFVKAFVFGNVLVAVSMAIALMGVAVHVWFFAYFSGVDMVTITINDYNEKFLEFWLFVHMTTVFVILGFEKNREYVATLLTD
jgi:hypothetical protein